MESNKNEFMEALAVVREAADDYARAWLEDGASLAQSGYYYRVLADTYKAMYEDPESWIKQAPLVLRCAREYKERR